MRNQDGSIDITLDPLFSGWAIPLKIVFTSPYHISDPSTNSDQ
jgi:hypothetical protein